jgi:hypothetical protein
VINYRASYAEETAAMVQALITYGNLRPNEIAFFTQRDAYGDSGFVGGMAALKKNGLKDETQITHGRYERNSLAVENSLAALWLALMPPRQSSSGLPETIISIPCFSMFHLSELHPWPRLLGMKMMES